MNLRLRKIIAREFIYLLLGIFLISLIFFGYHYLHTNNRISCEKLENEIENLTNDSPRRQLLWIELSEEKFVEGSFKEFQLKYSDVGNQEFLFNLLRNNGVFNGSLAEFRLKYFRKELANEDIYQIYIKEKCWVNKDDFNSLLKDQSTIDWLYKEFVATGYKKSMTDFKKLIFGTEDKLLPDRELHERYQTIKNLKQKLEKRRLSIFNSYFDEEFWGVALILFSILFIFRYLIYGIRWSLKQMKNE